ncbi:MAG TPA: CvpA family protein [Candidatus Saccharimonadia bacterium]|nr:CvpA family protein [Candidatus Saccharimonadia bacterium]
MIINLLIIAIFVYAAYVGTKRGMALIAFELASFIIATAIALVTYHPVGSVIKTVAHISLSLGDVAGFVLVWMVIETACAVFVRFKLLPHLTRQIQLSLPNQVGGALLNALKSVIVVALSLIVFAGLPLSSQTKDTVTGAFIPKLFLSSTGQLQNWLAAGLGHDLGESLNFFTVTPDPESTERIELGYTTTGTVDPADEAAMLIELNHERTSRGIAPLALNIKARAVARAHSVDMFAKGYFSHINNAGQNPFDRMKAGGVQFGAAGENLALAPTLQLAETGLMNSPPHRANILDPVYRSVGIGIINGGPYGLMITQDFTDE